jgi:hypothetical protein
VIGRPAGLERSLTRKTTRAWAVWRACVGVAVAAQGAVVALDPLARRLIRCNPTARTAPMRRCLPSQAVPVPVRGAPHHTDDLSWLMDRWTTGDRSTIRPLPSRARLLAREPVESGARKRRRRRRRAARRARARRQCSELGAWPRGHEGEAPGPEGKGSRTLRLESAAVRWLMMRFLMLRRLTTGGCWTKSGLLVPPCLSPRLRLTCTTLALCLF